MTRAFRVLFSLVTMACGARTSLFDAEGSAGAGALGVPEAGRGGDVVRGGAATSGGSAGQPQGGMGGTAEFFCSQCERIVLLPCQRVLCDEPGEQCLLGAVEDGVGCTPLPFACETDGVCREGKCVGVPLDCSVFDSECSEGVCTNGQCTPQPIDYCEAGDQCCPASCDNSVDSDCDD